MRRPIRERRARALLGALLLLASESAHGAPPADRAATSVAQGTAGDGPTIDESTWVDHDRRPIRRPPDWEPSYWGSQFHQAILLPLSHLFDIPDKLLWGARKLGARTRREAVNVNAFDEAPNSSWFTNRNHRRPVPVAELREGPDSVFLPAKPWTIKHAKQRGFSVGFQIKDARGAKWLVKMDPPGYPQLASGADMVSRTLMHAAGYNVPHNTPVRFRRGDVTIDVDLIRGTEGERFTEADLDSLLTRAAVFPDGSYSAFASLFLPGHALGAPSTLRRRPGDTNDWYAHTNRRELRGLFVLFAWINNWDAKDHQWLDMFAETRDSLGHVEHYLLDVGSSLGAAALGPKDLEVGFENEFDLSWVGRRTVTLGFIQEPWRRAHQETGIPSVGNFESEVFAPQDFKQEIPHPAFREMTDRDGYWGAKIVASFSDAQVAAAVDAGNYEDPRAREYLVRNLIVRRDKIARHWFDRVAPLDYFWVKDNTLRFQDLAVDIGLVGARSYDVEVESEGRGRPGVKLTHLNTPELTLLNLGTGASRMSLVILVTGNRAKPTHVELARKGDAWVVTRVRHG
jgi:hypothetical protein